MTYEDAVATISSALKGIETAIGQPTGWEIAGVVVAAFAAFGTLLLGALNITLLVRQSRQDSRDKRFRFAQGLIAEFANRAKMGANQSWRNSEARTQTEIDLRATAMQQDFPNGFELADWVLKKTDPIDFTNLDALSDEIGTKCLLWANNPASFKKQQPA